jgi:hypothetical protein
MALRLKHGLGDILNPTAGTAVDCGLFAGGFFNKTCWCLSFPSLCSQSDYVAARAVADPTVYNTLKEAPVVGAPAGAVLTTAPASGAQAQGTIDALVAQQNADWQAQNTASMQQTQSNLDQLAAEYPSAGVPWWVWVAGGVGLLAVVAIGGGSPRRYGR